MTPARPLFSIVTAVFNVEPYLPEFIASIEGQRFGLGRIEVIAVDDGSTDGSLAMLQAWAARRPELVKVLTKPNGGQATARNLGIEHATGEWVTFSDPDDMLDRDFFAAASTFIERHPGIEILGGRPIVLDEAEGRVTRHPRARQYDLGNRAVDLLRDPNVFPGGTNLCLFRLDRVQSAGLRFDPRLRPVFEDVHFTANFILLLPKPRVGIVSDMAYVYRRRATNDSTLQGGWGHPGRFTDVLVYGHLDLLHAARERSGSVPAWVQQLLVYDLSWYLSEGEKTATLIRIPAELLPRFHELFCEIIRQLDPEVVPRHAMRALQPRWIDLFAHSCRASSWHSTVAELTKIDRATGLQRVTFRFVGNPPDTAFLVNGNPVSPAYEKTTSVTYFERTFLNERLSWLPIDAGLELRLDGSPVPIEAIRRNRAGRRYASRFGQLRSILARNPHGPRLRANTRRGLSRALKTPLRLLAQSPLFSRYRGAWVLMDRMDDAGDNAERLFDHLRSQRPDINAWFVIEKDTPAWTRLQSAGVPRLVARRSLRWTILMLNCSWLISSHADQPVAEPPQIMSFIRRPQWKSAFLQHGVTQVDLSRWLNKREFDFVAATTPPEIRSMIADGTPYIYTAREVRLTGMPRFDALLAKGRSVPPLERDIVVVAPTWRKWLALDMDLDSGGRAVDTAFWDSDYLANWLALLTSARIGEAVASRGWHLAFMPHPNFQQVLPQIQLPSSVQRISYADGDPQDTYARAALLVTDYSSVAFDVAALDRPVVYFQFDRERFLGGGHIGSPGYFDYGRDGFGPVAEDLDQAERAILRSVTNGPHPSQEYLARIEATFPNRDGSACARVVTAIEELSRPYEPPPMAPGR